MHNLITKNKEAITKLCKRLHVKRLYVFGSIVTESFTPETDIDLLLAFNESIPISEYTDNYFTLHYSLHKILGRKIDLITERSLSNPYFIASLNESKVLLYET